MKKILIGIAFIAIVFSVFDYYVMTLTSRNYHAQDFVIAPGQNIIAVGENLEMQGFLDSRIAFYYYAWKKKLRGKIAHGEYVIPERSSLGEMTRIFVEGDAKMVKKTEVRITFPEGKMAQKMAEILKENGLPGDDFLNIVQNPPSSLRREFTFLESVTTLEGYLFPETYDFFLDATGKDIVRRMVQEFDKRLTQEKRTRIAESERTLHEVVTLASIVEGESYKSEERPTVAGVFQNRLNQDIALGSDATIDYLTGKPEVKHTLDDLEIDSPYNTYKYVGLPPGPVNNPSLEAIEAAITPKETEYLFFLNSNLDPNARGETIFSTTYQEHLINKAKHSL